MNSKSIVLSTNESKFSNTFNVPLHLDDEKYEIALVSLDVFYNIPNITKNNNHFKFSLDSGKTWAQFQIPVGCYTLQTLSKEIFRTMEYMGHEKYFTFDANSATLKTIITIIRKDFQIDFTYKKSFGSILGFNTILYDGYNASSNKINMLSNRIFVKTNLAESSCYNKTTFPFIYSFFPNALPGDIIIEKPHTLIYHKLINNSLHHIEISLVDDKGNDIDLNGETLTIELNIRRTHETKS